MTRSEDSSGTAIICGRCGQHRPLTGTCPHCDGRFSTSHAWFLSAVVTEAQADLITRRFWDPEFQVSVQLAGAGLVHVRVRATSSLMPLKERSRVLELLRAFDAYRSRPH